MSVSAFPYAVFVSVAGETITLHGSTGSPITLTDNALSPADAQAVWLFQNDGEVWRMRFVQSDSQYQAGVSWTDWQPTPGQDYWIKATQSGVTSPGDVPDTGDTLNTWHKVAGSGAGHRSWGWTETGLGTTSGTVRVDISTDSSGTPIVATGYYKGVALAEP